MGALTTRYALYLPGGGSSGTITPDETVDIDRLNDNFRRIDTELGIPTVASTAALPGTPAVDAVRNVTASDDILRWNGTAWVSVLPQRLTQTKLDARYVQLGATSFDSRYYTQTQLLSGGVLDSRYPSRSATSAVITQAMLPFKIAFGSVNFPTAVDNGNSFSSNANITYSGFTNPPQIVAMGQSADGGYISVTTTAAPTATAATLMLRRRNAFTTNCFWIAIGT